MKRRHRDETAGHSLVEMLIALGILVLVVAAATGGWIFTVRGERLTSTQSELDMDVRKTMENLKRDLRLSSLDKMYFYPPGPGPYTGLSFPLPADTNNDGLIEMTPGESNILWMSTVIYHVWSGSPNKLLRTTFAPRDNSLTDAQCQEQLASVISNGNGSATYGASNASTRMIFQNLFTWSLWGKGSTHDGYAPDLQRDMGVDYGCILLGPGAHSVRFTVTGKNPKSTGYKLGVDRLIASPCEVEREAEAQIPPSSQAGATAAWEYMAQGSWSGNYQLSFPASSTGSYFTLTIDNDRWEETNFRGQGALCRRTIVGFDPTLTPNDYIVQLEGSPGYPWGNSDPYAWTPTGQTASESPFTDDSISFTGCVVRVLLRGGGQSQNNATIRFSGHIPYVYFVGTGIRRLHIKAAYIAEASTHSNYTMNAASSGTRLYFNTGGGYTAEEATIYDGFWASTYNANTAFDIDSAKSYLITYLVDTDYGRTQMWPETHPGAPGAYVIPSSENPTPSTAQAADWSTKPVTIVTNVPGIYALYTTYPTNGIFTSQILDTKIDVPVYSTISWNADKPSGTAVKMKIRAGNQPDLSDAPAWSNVTAVSSSPADITCDDERYVQFQAILEPNSTGWSTPRLKDVTIKWAGATRVVDIAATMTKGPQYGIAEVTVDGKPLTKALRVDLSIYEDIVGWGKANKRITSSMTTEIEPRNTGK